jgi:hypothetical protein
MRELRHLMGITRSPYLARIVAGVLTASMLSGLFALPSSSAPEAYGSYAGWARAQLRVPVDEALESALSKAAESRPISFQDFVEAFLKAYDQEGSGHSAALAFTDVDLSDDALITYLQRRYVRISDEGTLPRTYLTTAPSFHPGIATGGYVGVEGQPTRSFIPVYEPQEYGAREVTILLLRILSSANPLGP